MCLFPGPVPFLQVSFPCRFWVHPVAANREQQGDYGNLILELRAADQVLFHRYFRVSVSQFDEILSIIGPSNTRWCSSRPVCRGGGYGGCNPP